jgi:hypothetical protein
MSFTHLAYLGNAKAQSYLCLLSQLLALSPKSCGIDGGQNGTDMGFLKELWFALKISNPPSDPPHSLNIHHMTLSFSEEGSTVQYSHRVWDTHETSQVD